MMSLSDLKPLCSEQIMAAACSAHQILTFCHSSSHKMCPMGWRWFKTSLKRTKHIGPPMANIFDMQKDSCFHFYFKRISNHLCMKEPQTIRKIINGFQRWKENVISQAEMVTGLLLSVQGQRHDLSNFTEVKK